MLVLLLACADPPAPVEPAPAPVPVGPDIAVDGPTVDLGRVRVGGELTLVVPIRNDGDETLTLQSPILEDASGKFALDPLPTPYVLAGGEVALTVRFTGTTAGSASTRLLLPSDDADEPLVELVAVAHATAPSITLDPPGLDFGTLEERCVDTQAVVVRNDGDDDLVVTDLAVEGLQEAFTLDLAEAENGPLPWTIPPGGATRVWASFTPDRALAYAASLVVRSDDADNPTAAATLDGVATDNARVIDNFRTDGAAVDFVFALGGAESDALADDLVAALPTLVDPLLALNVDFQLAAVRADDGCLVNGLLPDGTMTEEERASAFTGLLAATGTEHTLTLLERAVTEASATGCNPDLLRPMASLVLVGITDTATAAPQAAGVYTTLFEGATAHADESSAWAFAPDGGTCGDPDGAWTAVSAATGGTYLSVCDGMTTNLAALAAATAVAQDTFPLSKLPWPDTLVVQIDGATTRAWTYDATANAVVFDATSAPAVGTPIRAFYDAIPVCGSE